MERIGIAIISILIVAAFVGGVYFKDDAVKLYSSFNSKVEDLKQVNIGEIVTEMKKQVSMPAPLNVGGGETNTTLLQSKIITETNLQRQENGNLPALKENVLLDRAAAAKANDMFLNQYFEHISPSGVGPGDLVQNNGYEYIIAGENLILGNFDSEKEAVQDWMNSPGHRANILNNRFTEIGVAVIKGTYKGETVWIGVQEFGLPLSTCTQPSVNIKNQIDTAKTQLESFSVLIEEKKQELEASPSSSAAYQQMVENYNNLVGQYNSLASQVKNLINSYNIQVNAFNNCVAGQ